MNALQKTLLILSLACLPLTACKPQSQPANQATAANTQTQQPTQHDDHHDHDHHDDAHPHNHDDGDSCGEDCGHHDHDEHQHHHHDDDDDDDCGSEAANKKLPPPIQPGQTLSFGQAITDSSTPLSLSDAIKKVDDVKDKTIKLAGNVDRVCSAMGCWMTFKDDATNQSIRIVMKKHSFFVPRNSKGAYAIAEGSLSKQVVPKELLQHYAQETHEKIDIPAQDAVQYVFTADGVQLSMPKS